MLSDEREEMLPALSVVYVGTLPPHTGGSAVSGALLLQGLACRGWRIASLSPLTKESTHAAATFDSDHPEMRIERFEVPAYETAPNEPASDDYRRREHEGIAAKLPQLIEEQRPDVLLAGRETFAWHVPEFAERYGLPYVVRAAGATTIGMLRGQHPPDVTRRLVERLARAAAVVSPAAHLARKLRSVGVANVLHIANAVDLDRFRPRPKDGRLLQQLGVGSGDRIVVHASNLKALKRPLDVVACARIALERDPCLVFVVAGDGPLRAAMEEEARRAAIAGHFRFVGWIEQDEMPAYLNAADAVVMPCEDETLARVYLETMACGRVLVASDIDAAREVVDDGRSGLLFRTGDIQHMAQKVLMAVGDAALRDRLGREARATMGRHALAPALNAYAQLFRDVAGRRPARGGSDAWATSPRSC